MTPQAPRARQSAIGQIETAVRMDRNRQCSRSCRWASMRQGRSAPRRPNPFCLSRPSLLWSEPHRALRHVHSTRRLVPCQDGARSPLAPCHTVWSTPRQARFWPSLRAGRPRLTAEAASPSPCPSPVQGRGEQTYPRLLRMALRPLTAAESSSMASVASSSGSGKSEASLRESSLSHLRPSSL